MKVNIPKSDILDSKLNGDISLFELISDKIKFSNEVDDRYIQKLHTMTSKERYVLIKKIYDKYESKTYKDKEYTLGYEPREDLYDIIFKYGAIYGKPDMENINGYFPEERYIIDGKIAISQIYGQGTITHVEFL